MAPILEQIANTPPMTAAAAAPSFCAFVLDGKITHQIIKTKNIFLIAIFLCKDQLITKACQSLQIMKFLPPYLWVGAMLIILFFKKKSNKKPLHFCKGCVLKYTLFNSLLHKMQQNPTLLIPCSLVLVILIIVSSS